MSRSPRAKEKATALAWEHFLLPRKGGKQQMPENGEECGTGDAWGVQWSLVCTSGSLVRNEVWFPSSGEHPFHPPTTLRAGPPQLEHTPFPDKALLGGTPSWLIPLPIFLPSPTCVDPGSCHTHPPPESFLQEKHLRAGKLSHCFPMSLPATGSERTFFFNLSLLVGG